MKTARILIDGASSLVLDYEIPDHFPEVLPGCRVLVPLRNKPSYGTVISINCNPAVQDFLFKPISKLIDPKPMVSDTMLDLAKWASDYYAVPLEQMMRCLLPETVKQENTAEKTIKQLKLTHRVTSEELQALFKKAPKQASILEDLMRLDSGTETLENLGGAQLLPPAKALQKKGLVSIEEVRVHRDPASHEVYAPSHPLSLNESQQQALDIILQTTKLEDKKPILLQGITGSGKTEVYLQAVEEVVSSGKNALILVPEISLTPQTMQRFKSRFSHIDGGVAMLHSQLSEGERFDEWHAIRQGKAKIAIGPRSAVFAPVQNLGLIIVDEEHDSSYKQENSPRYHGRDLAVLRGHLEKAAVVLGSATPSLESVHNVNIGKYIIARLDQRADGQKLPLVRILDMRVEGRNKESQSIISERLRLSIDDRLNKGEQAILLLNRRGFARSLQCPDCGHVMECHHCSLPLTYHREEHRLICHLCGYKELTPPKCPACKSLNILFQGYGTEKVEGLLKHVFPSARIQRIDADIARRKNAVRDILARFRAHKIDILLGTQMIAKGLDFPNVTLVGVLNADVGLYIPDPRSGERTFQLMTQVAGRAGRGDIDGEVIIQTYTPQSPSLQYARHHDCDGFAEQELEIRKMFNLPPFRHIALLTVRSEHEGMAEFAMQTIARRIKEADTKSLLEITEPMPASIPKAHGQFRFQITIKSKSARNISRIAGGVLTKLNIGDGITAILDIDAMSFL